MLNGRKGTKYPGAISVMYAGPPSQAWYVMWHDQVLRIMTTRAEAEHYATQLTTPGVEPIHPHREERKRRAKEKARGVFDEAIDCMRGDPGFQELARKREVEAKAARMQYGRQLFHPGDYVTHVDQEGYPWVGTVTSATGYLEDDFDGPGHYYEVKWWNPALRQYHRDYLHQDLLRLHV